eukprot:jgi/Botrbrau1/8649/Bobra.0087s0004.1
MPRIRTWHVLVLGILGLLAQSQIGTVTAEDESDVDTDPTLELGEPFWDWKDGQTLEAAINEAFTTGADRIQAAGGGGGGGHGGGGAGGGGHGGAGGGSRGGRGGGAGAGGHSAGGAGRSGGGGAGGGGRGGGGGGGAGGGGGGGGAGGGGRGGGGGYPGTNNPGGSNDDHNRGPRPTSGAGWYGNPKGYWDGPGGRWGFGGWVGGNGGYYNGRTTQWWRGYNADPYGGYWKAGRYWWPYAPGRWGWWSGGCWSCGSFVYLVGDKYYSCPPCTFYNGYACVAINQFQSYSGQCNPSVGDCPVCQYFSPTYGTCIQGDYC